MPESHTKIAVLYNRGPAVAMKETMVLPRAHVALSRKVQLRQLCSQYYNRLPCKRYRVSLTVRAVAMQYAASGLMILQCCNAMSCE